MYSDVAVFYELLNPEFIVFTKFSNAVMTDLLGFLVITKLMLGEKHRCI